MSASVFRLRPWDSAFFGFPVADLLLRPPLEDIVGEVAITALRTANVRLAYWSLPPGAPPLPAVLATTAWTLADERLTFAAPPAALPAVKPAAVVPLPAGAGWAEQLTRLAYEAGAYSRFRVDPHMPPGTFERLYTEWVRRSLTLELCEVVFGWCTAAGQLAGFVTVGRDADVAVIQLIAVRADLRRQGVGAALVAAVAQWATRQGLPTVRVATQRANPAVAFYERTGFRAVQAADIYHLWL